MLKKLQKRPISKSNGKARSSVGSNAVDFFFATIYPGLSNWLNKMIGNPTVMTAPLVLTLPSGENVVMGFSCMGLQLMSCWISLMILLPGKMVVRLVSTIAGILLILIINACRISLLLYAIHHHWAQWSFIDHHDLFNLVAYWLLLCAFFAYTRIQKSFEKKFKVVSAS